MKLRASRFAVLIVSCGLTAFAAEPVSRGSKDLLVLYTFDRDPENVVRDRSAVEEPLDLRIEKPTTVNRQAGRLGVTASTQITSAEPARKIVAAIKKSGELTIEAWVKPNDNRQDGPARIVTLSANPGERNFTLGQDGGKFDVRLRTSATNGNGIPSLSTSEGVVRTQLTHVVYTIDAGGTARIFINGKEQAAQKIGGDLSGWSDNFRLSLANELTGDRPWLGELHLVAIFSRALSAEEIARHFGAGVPASADLAALLPPPVSRRVGFLADVQPILRQHCYECHAAGNEEGGLNLGVRQRALEGGEHGIVLTNGDSVNSRLIHLVAAIDQREVMPPADPRLTKEEVGILRAWIDQGLDWPDGTDVLDPRLERAKTHWAFQPLREIAVPNVGDESWCQTPIDRFILARLEAAALSPSPKTSAQQFCRRVHFDVIGLPPSPEEMDQFEAAAQQDSKAAYESLVGRLLESRHFGERWGRHWLDVAHYADSDGMESDRDRPNAYHFRDFVIRAFNDDVPFDQFVRWQIAGDEYEPQNPAAVAATGFLAAGPHEVLEPRLLEEERLRQRYNELDDLLSTLGTSLLGLTIGCARCHDHKYDAITSRDYYRMMSAFHSGDRAEIPLAGSSEKALGYRDLGPDVKTTWLFKRADFYDRRQTVPFGVIDALSQDKPAQDYWNEARQASAAKDTTFQRRALAEWIADVNHGAGALLARVIVNRLWQHHFGEGLVRTVGDFGARSDPPTHPELLEWLAHDLVQHGWKLKRLHRLMLTSAVYRQASGGSSAPSDPESRLFGRMRPKRLEAEILRDALLAASGTMNREPFGPPFKPPISNEAMLARNIKDPYPNNVQDSPAVRRRSVYMFHKRVVPYPLMQAFDKPDAQQSCGRRDITTVAPQALALLNDPFVRTVSQDFADRLLKDSGDDPAAWIDRAYRLALSRPPNDLERAASLEFIETQMNERKNRSDKTPPEEIRRKALADFCQALFSLNEFLYID